MNRKRLIYILLGPALLGLCTVGLKDIFGTTGAEAIGVALWMIFWWITRPVHITVTAIVPPITNAFLNMIPMASVLSNYSSESIRIRSDYLPVGGNRSGSENRFEGIIYRWSVDEVSNDRMVVGYCDLFLCSAEYRSRYAVLPDCRSDVKGGRI